ncbi:MAG: hypothetical protein HY302_08720 [Opitutae bacterium]|nr:hypothetical protein [Opitutae bacterium]
MNTVCRRLGRLFSAAALAIFAGGLLNHAATAAVTTASTTYKGQASIVVITDSTSIPGGSLLLCDTGMLPSTGGSLEQTISDVNVADGGLLIKSALASTVGSGPQTVSDTAITGLSVELMPPNGGMSFVTADFVGGTANATCDANGKVTLTGGVNIQNLVLNGQPVTVTGQPNQVVEFPGGRMIINEQASDLGDGTGEIVVTALHIVEDGCLNGLFGYAQAGITCGSKPPGESDCGKLTGGGWITGTPTGAKGTFGVSGGIRRGEFWGHLNYIDHGTGMHVRSTAVTGFTVDPNDADCRIITYNVLINDATGTATVRACDKGEPGRDDIFEITLSDGYRAGGDLGGARPGGGNIQLHKCPPGWAR